jgi:hypothetical protein
MRRRFTPLMLLIVTTLLAASCGGSSGEAPAAGRTVGDEASEWDVEQAIARTELIEAALDNGLSRSQASCMIDTATANGDVGLDTLEGLDLSATTGSRVGGTRADLLADALVECGPDVVARLHAEVPGSASIPASHAVEADCLTNAWVDAVRGAYADRFAGRGGDPEAIDVVAIIDGCDAAGALVLGASNAGELDLFALTTLEWECLVARLGADDFLEVFPTPEEPGDALERMGSRVAPDVAYCKEFLGTRRPAPGADGSDGGDANG